MKKKIILSLDLATKISGYCVMSLDEKLILYGTITKEKYKNYTKDKYPVSSIKNAKSIANQIVELYHELKEKYEIKNVVIEELNIGQGSTVATKALSFLHGFIIWDLIKDAHKIKFIKSSEWRSKAKVKSFHPPKGEVMSRRDKLKIAAIIHVNNKYGLSLVYEDNDIADAICIGLGFLKS